MAAKVTKKRVGEMLKAVLLELQQMGGEARLKEVLVRVEPKLNLTDYERATYEKSGYVRWESIIHFYSIDCIKAGYIQKSGGKWYLTEQGAVALKMPAEEFIRTAQEKYRVWKDSRIVASNEIVTEREETELAVRQTAYEQAAEQARTEIEEHIKSLGWYEFQKIVSELLIGMGHHIAYLAPPGPDGGVDIIAYSDPLGIQTPHLKVQVKHREEKAKITEVRELHGLLKDNTEIGLFVSSGGFARGIAEETRKLSKHIELMDLERLIDLWEQHYDKLRETGKALIPLVRLYFLAPPEE